MPHTDQARGSNRVRVTHMLVLVLFAALSTIAFAQFAGGVANAQNNDASQVSECANIPSPAQGINLRVVNFLPEAVVVRSSRLSFNLQPGKTRDVAVVASENWEWARIVGTPDTLMRHRIVLNNASTQCYVIGDPSANITVTPAATAGTEPVWQATLVITGHGYGIAPWSPWSPDGSKLAVADFDNTTGVWDATTGANVATLTGHTAHVRNSAWSPDSSKLASASDDGTVRIWDATTGASLATLTGHTGGVDDLAWSPDGSKVASASGLADGIIQVWDATTGANVATLTGHTHYLKGIAWSPDGSKLASVSSDQTVRVWDATAGTNLATISNGISVGTSVAWSPDSSKVASGFEKDKVGVWDATTGANVATLTGHTDYVRDIAWSPDGSKLASASDDESIRLWNVETNASLATLTGHTSTVGSLAWSPDGSKLASAAAASGGDEPVRLWDGTTGASLAVLTGHTSAASELAWSPDASKLASEGDNTVRVWAEVAAPATATPPATAVAPTTVPTTVPTTATTAPTTAATNTPAATATPASTPTGTPDPSALAFEPPMLEFVWVKGGPNPVSQSVLARNASGKVGWHPSAWVKDAGTSWVTGGLQMNIEVNPANANLDVGVHESQFVLDANGKSITLPVKITVVSANGTLQVNRKQLNFGGFVGDPIADQVVDVTFTGLNSTNWTASGPSWLTLAPANGSVAATAPTTLTVGIDTAAIGDAGKYTGTLTVSDGKTTHEIAVELSQVAPGSPTIQLYGLEVTQGIQNLLNDIPFVAERPVFVRGHVRSLTGDPIEKVTAQLIGTRNGVALGTLNPSNSGGSITIGADPDRAQLHESFLFELPESWRTGTVTLRLEGKSQPIACVDPAEKSTSNGAPNDCTVTLTYETIPALPIKYFLYAEQGTINYSDARRSSTATFTANAEHANATSRQLLAGLPIPRVDQQINATTLTFPGVRDNAAQSKMDRIMKAEHEKAGSPSRHFYGLFARYETKPDPKASIQGGPGGVAVVPGFFGFGEYYTFQPMATLNMHEIGHNLGREHVNCGNPASPDLNYPYPEQRISRELSGNDAYYGFNIVTQDIYPPTYKDFMSYCWPNWISPYTYKAMIERLKIHYKAPAAGNSGTGQAAASPSSPILLINGSITGTVAGSIDGVVGDNASAAIPAAAASDYSVRLEDANGQTIATYPVTPQEVHAQNDGDAVIYAVAVPRPDDLERVVLLYEAEPLAERIASTSAPTLTLTTPVGGEIFDSQLFSITWSASDADGDELRFNVDYSIDDGAIWQKLVWDWPDTAVAIDSVHLAGSTQARIRVSANDGFLTTFVESEGFVVADHPPVAIILSTDLNRYYVGGQTILLEGTGYDVEDGELSDLTWYSDRDGVLGTGPTLLLEADDLAEGPHLIRLEATDSANQSSFGDPTMGAIRAEDFVAVNDTVSFDIHYDPLTLPAELAVAPDLGFSTTSGATQLLTGTLTLSNLGDGALGWTASSDAANVTLSSDSGDTPATVVVTVDPTGLAEGVHEGTLTFTPTEATLAPVTVNYFINVYPPSQISSTLPRIQAESGTYAGDAASSDIYSGFDGTGFAAYLTAAESAVQLNANVASAGTYGLNIRYAAGPHGSEADRTISLYVNGSKIRQLSFERTLDWTEWADLTTSIDLDAGDNTIEFRIDSDDTGYINIDYIAGVSTSDEPDATDNNTGDQADAESDEPIDDAELPTAGSDTASDAVPQIATCDATDVPAPTHGGVTVRFVNENGAVAVVYWRDFDGNLVEYHRLDADGFVDQETFESHEWVVQDEVGNVLVDYTASAAETQCVLIEQP